MRYIVKCIEEDIDFGCEERAADAPVMAVVTLEDPNGACTVVKAEDALLYERDINEGDTVYFDEMQKLAKVLDDSWVDRKEMGTEEAMRFIGRMMDVKAGKAITWKCPFCGGNVGLVKQDGGHAVIGCNECDMRIELES